MRGLGKLTVCFPWAPCGRVCEQCPVASRLRVVAQGGRAGCLGRTSPREGTAWIYFKHRGGRASVGRLLCSGATRELGPPLPGPSSGSALA